MGECKCVCTYTNVQACITEHTLSFARNQKTHLFSVISFPLTMTEKRMSLRVSGKGQCVLQRKLVHLYMYTHTHTPHTHACAHTHTHTHTYTPSYPTPPPTQHTHTYTHVHTMNNYMHLERLEHLVDQLVDWLTCY